MPSIDRLHRARRAQVPTPRRFVPAAGRPLILSNIRGPWRPSGAVGGAGVFAVVWHSRSGAFWAPLHDFEPAAQLQLIAECRWIDQQAGFPGAWPHGRAG